MRKAKIVIVESTRKLAGLPKDDRGKPLKPGDTVLLVNQTDARLNGPWIVRPKNWKRPGWYEDSVRDKLLRLSVAKRTLIVRFIMNLNDLRDACYANSKAKGFHDGAGKTIGDDIALMHSELSEALEDHRSGHTPDEMWYESRHGVKQLSPTRIEGTVEGRTEVPNKPCGIPSEMADVIIRILDFCGKYGIDIDKAVKEKMAYNETRSYRHGGRAI